MRKIFAILFVVIAGFAFLGCPKDNSLEKLRENELRKLDEFIAKHYLDSVPKASGLYYIETIKGEGDTIFPGDRVQIYYATWTIDSLLIDESSGYTVGQKFEPLEFIVGKGEVLKGLEEAIQYMKLNGKASLVLPSEVAYGQNNKDGIPGFTTLLMEIEVYKVYHRKKPDDEGSK
jgi:FKBP-type peptidyl-prolyl cis-trans isomerase FkpA